MRERRARVVLSIASLLVVLLALEVYLRLFPHTLPHALANQVATGYSTALFGIYRRDPVLHMNLMRPHYAREMYFNGHRWHHRTDSWGFRNPIDRATASVVLLGDSMVYGHGLEEHQTIRHRLEALLGEPVANLGIQGGSIHQEYQLLLHWGLLLRPREVLVFFLANDIVDLTVYLSDEEMRRFLATAVGDHATPYVRGRGRGASLWDRLWDELYLPRAYAVLRSAVWARGPAPVAPAPQPPTLAGAGAEEDPGPEGVSLADPLLERNPRLRLAVRFHLHALRKLENLAARHGFVFTHVFIHTGAMPPHEPLYERILTDFCRVQRIRLLSLRGPFETALRGGARLFLQDDGHYTAEGAWLAAEIVAADIRERRRGGRS